MDKKSVLKELAKIKYPKLEKDIISLKLVSDINIEAKSLHVTLDTNSNEAFHTIGTSIQKLLKEHFKDINIDKKLQPLPKKANFGSTKNPNNKAPYAKKIIAISSGKGGVGKSTVAANLAVGLAQKGLKVGLLDADIYGPSIPRLFGVQDEHLRWSDKNRILPSENFGVKVMSVGLTTPSGDTPLVWRSSVAISALMQFLEDVEWKELDYLIIDMPPGTGDVQLSMAEELPLYGAILVTTPQMLATDDVSRAVMMFKETSVPILGVVENMSYFIAPDTNTRYDIFGKEGAERLCETYGVKLLSQIPLSMPLRELSDKGHIPIALGDEEIKKIYKELVERVEEGV